MTAPERDQGVTDIDRVCLMFGEVAGLVADDWAIERGCVLGPENRAAFVARSTEWARELIAKHPQHGVRLAQYPADTMRRTIRFEFEIAFRRTLDDVTAAYVASGAR
jgi:hypothetical protein